MSMGGLWQHVIFTLPHGPEDSWEATYERLTQGVRSLTKGLSGRLVMTVVEASIRATETTWSVRSGWHVHLHVMWRIRRPLLAEELAIVARQWASTTGASLEHGCRFGMLADARHEPSRRQAASYITKIASEMSGEAKAAHGEHWTLGELMRRAAQGEWIELIQQYQRETKGKKLYQLDRRAAHLRDAAPPLELPEIVHTWVTEVDRKDFGKLARAERADPLAIYLPLEVAARSRGDPSDAIDEHVWYYLDEPPAPPE